MANNDLKKNLQGLFSDIGGTGHTAEDAAETSTHQPAETSSQATFADTVQFPPLELNTVAKICDLTATVFDIDELLEQAARLICKDFVLADVHIYLLKEVEDETRLILRANTGPKAEQYNNSHQLSLEIEDSLAVRVVRSHTGEFCNNFNQDSAYKRPAFLKKVKSELAVPMLIMGKAIGVLDIFSSKTNHFRPADVAIYRTLAAQIVVAVQNIRLLRDIEDQAGRLTTLNKMGETLNITATLDEIQKVAARHIPQIFSADHISLSFINRGRDSIELFALQPEVGAVPMGVQLTVANTPLDEVVNSQTLLNIPDLSGVNLANMPALAKEKIRSIIIAPLIAGQHVVGTLNVGSKKRNAYTIRDESLMAHVTGYLASTIENRKLFNQIQAALAETELLYEASADLNLVQSYDDILNVLRQYTNLGTGAHNVSLNYFDTPWEEDRDPEWVLVLTRWTELSTEAVSSRYPLSSFSSASEVIRADKPTVIEDVESDTRLDDNLRNLYMHRFKAKSTIFIPLVVGGQWIGYINAIYGEEAEISDDELRRIMALAGQAAVVTQNLYIFNLAEQQAKEMGSINILQNEVSRQLNLNHVLKTAYTEVKKLFALEAFVVSLYEAEADTIHYPIVYDNGKEETLDSRALPKESNLTTVIKSGEPVLVHRSPAQITALIKEATKDKELSTSFFGRPAASNLIVPMMLSQQTIGAISIQSYKYNAYTQRDIILLQNIASQISIAIENARLLEETQAQATNAIQREAYQKSIAQATALFTESGSAAIEDVLAILGEVTQVSRVYFVETLRDEEGNYWREVAEWCAQGIDPRHNDPKRQHILPNATPFLKGALRSEGIVSALVKNLPQPDRKLLKAQKAKSILMVSVPGNYALPGFIGFETVKKERVWSNEELNALQTTADALTNTLSKEDLLNQIQTTLSETETLYQASRIIGEAVSVQDLLRGVAEVAKALKFDTCALVLLDRAASDDESAQGRYYNYHIAAGEFKEATTHLRDEIIDWHLAQETLNNPEYLAIYRDSEDESTPMSEQVRSILRRQKLRGLVVVGLSSHQQALGFLNFGIKKPLTNLAESHTRQMRTVADQMVISLDNQRLLQRTETALTQAEAQAQRLNVLTQMSQALNQLEEITDVYDTVALYTSEIFQADRTSIALLTPDGERYTVLALQGEKGLTSVGAEESIQGSSIAVAVAENRIIVRTSTDEESLGGIRLFMVAPLYAGRRIIGTLNLGSKTAQAYTEADQSMLHQIASLLSSVLQNRELFAQTQQALNTAQTLYNVSQRINVADNLKAILKAIMDELPLAGINRALLLTFERNRAGSIETVTLGANWYSGQGAEPPVSGQHYHRSQFLSDSPLFSPKASYIDDLSKANLTDLTVWQDTATQALAIFPLLIGSRQLGSLLLLGDEPRHFSPEDVQPYLSLGPQIAISVENQRLLLETRIALKEVEATQRRYTLQAWESYQATRGAQSYERSQADSTYSEAGLDLQIDKALTKKETVILDNGATPSDGPEPATDSEAGLIVPLTVRDESIGILGLAQAKHQGGWLPEEIEMVEAIAAQFAQVAEELRLLDETQRRASREARINEIGDKIQAAQSYEEALQIAVREVGLSLQAPQTKVQLGDLE